MDPRARLTRQADSTDAMVFRRAGLSVSGKLSPPPRIPLARGGNDPLDDALGVLNDLTLGEAHDAPAKLCEHAIPSRIMTRAVLMGRPIDLDDEAGSCASEVRDVRPDDELPSEREAGL